MTRPPLPAAIPGEIERARLDNGLEIVLLRNPQAPIVSTALLYRVGARDEPPGASGAAHFLEHMMFKGSALYPAGEVDRRTQELGGTNNAFTSHDVTAYWFSFAADRWREALAIEADRMRSLRLDEREVDAERNVILEEIAMYRDDPWDALEMEVVATLYRDHPHGRPVLGDESDLERETRADLGELHGSFYRPDNAVLVIAGDFARDDALGAATETFGAIPRGAAPRPAVSAPRIAGTEQRVERRQGEVPRLLFALPAPPTDAPGHAELRLLATLLADGRTSRLQHELVEHGQLCLGVSASVSESEVASFFAVAADLLPAVELAEVEARTRAELARLAAEPVGEAELERAKQVFLADWVLGHERIHQQAVAAGIAAAQFDLGQPQRLLEAVAAADAAALQDTAARWLDPARGGVIGVCRPEGAAGRAA